MDAFATFMHSFLLAFVPIFVAVDAVGVLPLYIGLTEGLERAERRRTVVTSVLTALAVGVGFIFLGKGVFAFMGITPADFMVAGGVLLFIIATMDLVGNNQWVRKLAGIGAVPLGTPLIVGPATLTTCLMLVDQCGLWATLLAAVLNVLVAGVVMMGADPIARLLGKSGSKVVSKVASLLLAAIAVMMVRRGLGIIIVQFACARP